MSANFEQIIAAQKQMADAIAALESLKSGVAMAKQVVEFCNDRCKTALSKVVVEYLKQDMSSTAAEHHARADNRFRDEMKTIMKQTGEAEKLVKDWELQKLRFECARSILSSERSLLEMR